MMSTSGDVLEERLTGIIAGWGLVAPAIAFLEANKPLSFVGSQALLMLQPVVDLFIAREFTTDLANLLADRERLERLVDSLAAIEGKG
jgi:hypothetical protein